MVKRRRRQAEPKSIGSIRRSQVVGAFGIGALIDFVDQAVIIGGLDQWPAPTTPGYEPIAEPRLQRQLGVPLFAPPASPERGERGAGWKNDASRGIPAFVFPEWFIEKREDAHEEEGARWRRLVHHSRLNDGKFGGHPVTPVRWVRACPDGHIDDINWRTFVHRGETDCEGQLFLGEESTSGDLADIMVRCSCKKFRPFIEASARTDDPLGKCSGQTPWLGPRRTGEQMPCKNGHSARLLVRSATNAYFVDRVSAISIPSPKEPPICAAVTKAWDDFEDARDLGDVQRELNKRKHEELRSQFGADAVWAEVVRKRGPDDVSPPSRGLKAEELDALWQVPTQGHEDEDAYFDAHQVPLEAATSVIGARIAKLVLLDQLREVTVQTGFTRLEPPVRDLELSLDVKTAPLARTIKWLPAIELLGEGVFVGLDPKDVGAWRTLKPVRDRTALFEQGRRLAEGRGRTVPAGLVDPAFIMLHTFSHLLMTHLALECGYAASSLRERIYVDRPTERYGIIIQTGTPDCEGTLGGLVKAAGRMRDFVGDALEHGRLCSNDPICARHVPSDELVQRYAHGAACHGCLLIGETSCEWSNEYLDRALVIDTLETSGAGFFPGTER